MLTENRNRQAVSAVVLSVVAALPSYYGVGMVSYALGRPDTTRFVVGFFALVALGFAALLLGLAGSGLAAAGWRVPAVIPVLAALAVVPLVVMSVPLQYDQDLPVGIAVLATAGVVIGGTSLAARSTRQALVVFLSLSGAFYLACILMDLLRR
jgi:hypothetical protein